MSQPNEHADLNVLRVVTAGYEALADNGGALTLRPALPGAHGVRLLTEHLCDHQFVRLSLADAEISAVGNLQGGFR